MVYQPKLFSTQSERSFSSVDRALVFGTSGRRFDPFKDHLFALFAFLLNNFICVFHVNAANYVAFRFCRASNRVRSLLTEICPHDFLRRPSLNSVETEFASLLLPVGVLAAGVSPVLLLHLRQAHVQGNGSHRNFDNVSR